MKVRLTRGCLELVGECEEDFATVRAFAEATLHSGPLELRMVGNSLAIEATAAAPHRAREPLLVGFSMRGWADQLTDESQRGAPYQWEHGLEVRPAADPPEPPHSFIARAWVITYGLEKRAGSSQTDWVQLGDPVTVYYGEHASLKAGVAAVRKAYERSMLLRDGPKEP